MFSRGSTFVCSIGNAPLAAVLWAGGITPPAMSSSSPFQPLGLVPTTRHTNIGQTAPSLNYTSWLNIVFLLLAAALLWRFFTAGGRAMLAMMGGGPDDMADHKD